MAVRIRLKKMGRRHRPFFRLCAMDSRTPRDGRVIEELGFYDPMVKDVDARAVLKGERISYWLGVGAQPSDKARVLIKKYGENGTHLENQKAALERIRQKNAAIAAVTAAAQQRVEDRQRQLDAELAEEEEAAQEEAVQEEAAQESGEQAAS